MRKLVILSLIVVALASLVIAVQSYKSPQAIELAGGQDTGG
jgi:hypothetical protein